MAIRLMGYMIHIILFTFLIPINRYTILAIAIELCIEIEMSTYMQMIKINTNKIITFLICFCLR